MADQPKHYKKLAEAYPDVIAAYEALGNAVHAAGPIEAKTRALIKLGISAAGRHEGALHSHTRKALAAGASPEEIRHTILLALPTIGFPATMAALSWANDILPQ